MHGSPELLTEQGACSRLAYSVGCSVASTSSGGWNLALADVDAVMGSGTSRSREADVMELESYFENF